MTKQHRKNRIIEKEGVNATRSLFEGCGCVFQEVNLENDYGKDAYVDIGDEFATSSICAGIQIKSGSSFKHADGYRIPLRESDFEYWSASTVPMFGIVFDPIDQQLRWVNITQYLDTFTGPRKSYIPVDAHSVLTRETIWGEFAESVRSTIVGFRRHPLVQVCDEDPEVQYRAIGDCFVLGRSEPRLLIALRYLIFQVHESTFRRGVRALAHLTSHPDIYWTDANWIPSSVRANVLPHFVWSGEEILRLLSAAATEEWTRGGFGQDLFMLLIQDPGLDPKLEKAAVQLAKSDADPDLCLNAMHLLISRADDSAGELLNHMVNLIPSMKNTEMVQWMKEMLREEGCVLFW